MKDTGVIQKSNRLEGKKIALGLCGSIGVVESVKLIREIRRHGATPEVFATPDVFQFITALSLEWAVGGKIHAGGDGDITHLNPFDLSVIIPATLNTLHKASAGVCDNETLLLIASQLGHKSPLLFVPVMNRTLAQHPLYESTQKQLQSWGTHFFPSHFEEDRWKMPSLDALMEVIFPLLSLRV